MPYKEFKPDPVLSPYIDAFWEVTSCESKSFTERIMPDCCIDIIINLGADVMADGSGQNGMVLALYPRKHLALDAGIPVSVPSPAEFSIGHNVRSKAAVDSTLDLAKKAGAIITDHARDRFWGGYSGYFQDPDGHLWEVVYNPNMIPAD